MEKTFQLDQKETTQLQQLDLERTQALAAVGALSLDMEQARKNLDASAERQRGFIRNAVISRNIERYDNARVQGGALVVTLPEEPVQMPLPALGASTPKPERLNGPLPVDKE